MIPPEIRAVSQFNQRNQKNEEKTIMKIESKEYKLLDFIKIPLTISPIMTILKIVDMIISALIPSLQIMATAGFIDTAISIFNGQDDRSKLNIWLLWILLLISYKYITSAFMVMVKERMKIKLSEVFRIAVTEKRAMLHYKHVENNETWDLIERVGKDPAEKVREGFDILLSMASILVRVFSLMIMLWAHVWWVSLVIIVISTPLFWLAVRSGKVNYQASKEAVKYKRKASYLQSVLTGRENVEERALFAYSKELNNRYYGKFLAAYNIEFKAQRDRFVKMRSASQITIVISVLISFVLIPPLDLGLISVGMFMSFVTATFGLTHLMSWDLSYITSRLTGNIEYLKDLTEFSRLSETVGATDIPDIHVKEPAYIEFCDVSFAYPDTNVMILKNFNLKLLAKKHYAFIGVNGAGKTTITKLLTGQYNNYTGDIFIEGRNLRDFTQSELKATFSVVYQDFAKYQICMADSIGLGNIYDKAEAVINEAVKILELDEVISKLPEGLNTPLGKIMSNGIDLSGGEWQRIAIARSIVSPNPIKILDEPTAALDPIAESRIYKLFDKISKGKSTLFITHRLGAAKLADEIILIADGMVAEKGSHEELMDKRGYYAEMFEAQKGWYV